MEIRLLYYMCGCRLCYSGNNSSNMDVIAIIGGCWCIIIKDWLTCYYYNKC